MMIFKTKEEAKEYARKHIEPIRKRLSKSKGDQKVNEKVEEIKNKIKDQVNWQLGRYIDPIFLILDYQSYIDLKEEFISSDKIVIPSLKGDIELVIVLIRTKVSMRMVIPSVDDVLHKMKDLLSMKETYVKANEEQQTKADKDAVERVENLRVENERLDAEKKSGRQKLKRKIMRFGKKWR